MRTRWRASQLVCFVAFLAAGASAARGQEGAVLDQVEPAVVLDEESPDETGEVELASLLFQPPPALSTTTAPRQPTARTARSSRQANVRLASVPNMFGDLGLASGTVRVGGGPSGNEFLQGTFDIPSPGGSRRVKIAENDSPIPVDRVFFNYNHFHNVFSLSEQAVIPPGPPAVRQQSLDRFTLGGEKTFLDGWASVEVRMPFNGTYDANLDTVGIDGGNVGNLAVVLKSLLHLDDALAVGAGLAIDTPTGSDVFARIGNSRLQFRNEAVHVLPYIGFLWNPGDPTWGWSDGLFFTGFAQIDVATGGNTVDLLSPNGTLVQSLGRFTEQNLGFLDLAMGYWLYRNPHAERLTGLATVAEVHYTTSLQDADRLEAGGGGANLVISGVGNRFDVVNGTIGVQALLFDKSSLRVAGVFPIGGEDRRFFDSEIQVQFNRRF